MAHLGSFSENIVEGLGDKGEGMKYKSVVTNQSWECSIQHREYSQYYCNGCVQCRMSAKVMGGRDHFVNS